MIVELPLNPRRHRLIVIALTQACFRSLDESRTEEAVEYLSLAHDLNYIDPIGLPPHHRIESAAREKLKV